jgi:hypothetical protein
MSDLLDDNGYPTAAALVALDRFHGSPRDLVHHVSELVRDYGVFAVDDMADEWGRASKRLTLVTGGWSGCEEVIERLSDTMFHFSYWESSWRGGKHTYVVPANQWETPTLLGDPTL